jgi:RNA polymerase sigma factor (sigma-70 family)
MTTDNQNSLLTRPSLLARLKDWNQHTAWRAFEGDYAPLVLNIARKAGLTDVEADEVVQETLIAVAKKIAEFEHAGNVGSFRNWLYQQTRWRIADQFRHRARARNSSGSETKYAKANDQDDTDHISFSDQSATDPAFNQMWDTEWAEHLNQIALARVKNLVSARQFQLFDLHVLQSLSVSAAARAAGTTMAAVYMAKSRVGRVLQREIKLLRTAEEQ